MNRLRQAYQETIAPALSEELGLKNRLALPRLEKVVLNVGVGSLKDQAKVVEEIADNLAKITGQKPVSAKAKQSIAGFKVRAGQTVGLRVTLRGERMYDFIDKLVNVALPRLRDFRGLARKGFDGHGNYNLGVKEHTIFPEIQFDDVNRIHGLNITVVTTAKADQPAEALLRRFGLPFPDTSGASHKNAILQNNQE